MTTSQTSPDTTRGNLLTDIQESAESTPMPSTSVQMANHDSTHHDISSILERVVNLGTYQWDNSIPQLPFTLNINDYDADTTNYLLKLDFPQVIFEKSPLVVDKLKNYQYFKADIEIEVKINAQPFLQGALMLVYNPYYEQVGPMRSKGTRFMASQTTCPYKIVSIEEGTSLKLTCPYFNVNDMFDLSNPKDQFGTAFLYVFSPITGAEAGASIKYTVNARFVNPQFSVPTHVDVLPTYRDKHDAERLRAKGYRIQKRYAQSSRYAQVATDTGETSTRGPISSVAASVATVADALSGIPVLGSIASSVAWVSRAAAGTASVFGYSKPVSVVPQIKTVIKPNCTMIHSEGHDDGTTLALIQDNGIDGSTCFAENKDEMALSYIFGRPSYFYAKTVNTALFKDRKLLASWECSPFSQHQYGNPQDSQSLFLSGFSYASMCFGTLWSGAINFDIKIIKTAFHNGRFAIVYLPKTTMANVPPVLGNLLNTNYNVLVNLKEEEDGPKRTSIRISVPYMCETPMLETYKSSTNASNPGPDATTLETSHGCLAIYCLVDLSLPPTVPDQITFYVAHSGGEDYQIARPTLNLAPGFQSRYAEPRQVSHKRFAQSDTGAVFIPPDENLLVPSHNTMDVTPFTTGEPFKSLRALSKRFNRIATLKQTSDYVGLLTRSFYEDPVGGFRVMSRKNLIDEVHPSTLYMISHLYRFYNGSTCLKLIANSFGTRADSFLQFDEGRDSQTVVPISEAIGQPVFPQVQLMSGAYEIRTPYYRGVRCDVIGSARTPTLGDVRTCIRSRVMGGGGPATTETDIFEAAGDDFNCGFLVGPCVMQDRRNIKTEPASFPTGVTRTVNLPLTAAFSVGDIEGVPTVGVSTVSYTPALPEDTPNLYAISSASISTIDIHYTTNPLIVSYPLTSCYAGDRAAVAISLYIPRDDNRIIDEPATSAYLGALPDFTIDRKSVV